MDNSSLSISLPVVVSLVGCFIGVMTYLGNRKKQSKEDIEKEREAERRLVRIEAMLTNIEQNTSNLSQRVESHDHLLTKHETRLALVESKMKAKGGK